MPRGVVQEVEAVEEKPVAGVLTGMNALGYTFILTALIAGVAWIIFVAKSHGYIGEAEGAGDGGHNYKETIHVCFEAAVVSCLFYFVARHHFSNMHY